ncbi:XRE family transcriptional regulator [Hominisplanchenecus murintestinalis]|uniref:XRE family transcriptional regulator n=1 Tax=Hominisplanchenecus murintestinalis TaxID=2941517 RepID=A0AC61R0L1_9FIRM|nr:XRE family transcriptional regulator [Hominisplanchenecus murintestinalis]TGX99214.1 XRE family transcriptional regulator [Hominisplanchenecus murintestinalis]
MNKLKLESIMRLHGDTGTTLSKYLGMARSTFSAKINETNGAEFSQNEIAKMKKKYNLSAIEIEEIFFN